MGTPFGSRLAMRSVSALRRRMNGPQMGWKKRETASYRVNTFCENVTAGSAISAEMVLYQPFDGKRRSLRESYDSRARTAEVIPDRRRLAIEPTGTGWIAAPE